MERQRHGRLRAEQSSRHHLSPKQRRTRVIGTVVGVVLAAAAITGGPWVYARFYTPQPREPLELSSAEVKPDPSVPLNLDGEWTVREGSQAGYRLNEVLNDEESEVVGRTDEVSGESTITDGQLTQTTVVVQAASMTTDQASRDAYVLRALDVSTYPEATFELSEPVDVSAVSDATEPVAVQVPGRLTLAGTSVDVVADLRVQRNETGLEVAGQIPIDLTEFKLEPPDLGFVTVNSSATVEILLLLSD